MSTAPVTETQLHAYIDGELDAADRLRLEAWLAEHPERAAELAAWAAHKRRLHAAYDAVLDEPIPARLTASLAAATPRSLRRWPLALAASCASATLAGLLGWQLGLHQPRPVPGEGFMHRAAIAHAVYAPEVRHPVEVGADQEAHLVAWLSRRLGAQLKVPDLQARGFQLVGGRLLPAASGPGAQFMYQDATGTRLTLYLGAPDARYTGTAFRYAREDGLGVFYWVEGPFAYALSGPQPRAELLGIAEAAYRQLRP